MIERDDHVKHRWRRSRAIRAKTRDIEPQEHGVMRRTMPVNVV
jgi:hypothetical protein